MRPEDADLDVRAGNRLRGKTVIITGAGRGIGRAAARRMATEGAQLLLADLNAETLDQVIQETSEITTSSAFTGDLMQYATAEKLISTCLERYGQVDVLVNNIGGATALKPLWDWSDEEILAEMNRSILPTVWCCRAVLPTMIEQGQGRIVNVGAESVRNGLWDRAPYNMAKGAVHALTTSIARETADKGILCNCVAPAATGRTDGRLERRVDRKRSPEELAHIARINEMMLDSIPLGRPAYPEEQAAAIAFLASDDASFITGQVLSVNGGSSML
ncbi:MULTISPECIES: SDR family oxidoreductase [unclassified Nocardioides]|uniref:SDR family oxidoreductase n=1 Tax=unclassified Nocardioides TaxID=2615069 RepID=UPI00005702AD|nr:MULTISPECIES: SDR family oxidoreductase [unclassified Nocardioides]ABL81645.1 1,2-dihydroxycyclohexa-3,5-diene-1-carboxylate dehydrogenase [Nocardioides sp. JS614]